MINTTNTSRNPLLRRDTVVGVSPDSIDNPIVIIKADLNNKIRSQENKLLYFKKALRDFKEIYKQQFDEKLSDSEANEIGIRLLRFFKIIYRPIPVQEKENK